MEDVRFELVLEGDRGSVIFRCFSDIILNGRLWLFCFRFRVFERDLDSFRDLLFLSFILMSSFFIFCRFRGEVVFGFRAEGN